jgi:hypothetical protein
LTRHSMNMRATIAISFLIFLTYPLGAAMLEARNGQIRVKLGNKSSRRYEVISIQAQGSWIPALTSLHASTRVITAEEPNTVHPCDVYDVSRISGGLLLHGDCAVGSLEQRILLTDEPDVLAVEVKFVPKPNVGLCSVEDRYDFAPGRRNVETPSSGSVDFVWSQNIKNEADDDIPIWGFKSPIVMLQQGKVFTALMPRPSDRRPEPRALDLDVTSDTLPWLSYGAIPSQPYGHSYFRRSSNGSQKVPEGTVEYQYSILASSQPEKLGYRRAVRLLWASTGHQELLLSNDLQQNVVRSQLVTFDDWRKDTWIRYADELYRGFDCGGRQCGTLVSNRNPWGEWNKPAPDAWFNAWFQTLRSAYGWYLYGQRIGNDDIESKAESVLNLALSSPQNHGAFPTIYLLNDKRWIRDDGWAGFPDDYHTFDMSWTAYWMLEWARNLTLGRKAEILAFVRPYGDFLVKHQLASGVIPSWYDKELNPRSEFRDFNAETAASALFLASLAEVTGDNAYLNAATRAMSFIQREVLPRERWSDFETFLSCARKPFDFYDRWTAQYPQNNLSQIQAAEAYLELFRVTKERRYLELGSEVLDYLLLAQQVWNNPAFSPKVVGGFTTQNTDAEWSDARESYAAVLLWDYYKETANSEYLERAVAAARSTFAVAPWENWAHTGYIDEHGALTGFHWGAGSGMTSVEMMYPVLGDAFIDLHTGQGVGFNACSLHHIEVKNHSVSFDLDAVPGLRPITVRFSGVDPHASYRITWNGNQFKIIQGDTLAQSGYVIQQSDGGKPQ